MFVNKLFLFNIYFTLSAIFFVEDLILKNEKLIDYKTNKLYLYNNKRSCDIFLIRY